jgi:hypothetical protein
VADQVDARVISIQAEHDPVAAAAHLEALRFHPAHYREGTESGQILEHAIPASTQPHGAPTGRWSEPPEVRRAVPCNFNAGISFPGKPARTIGSSTFRSTAIGRKLWVEFPSASVTVSVTE